MRKFVTAAMLLKRIRIAVAFIIFGLVVSGLTAFPLEWELNILASLFVQNEQLQSR